MATAKILLPTRVCATHGSSTPTNSRSRIRSGVDFDNILTSLRTPLGIAEAAQVEAKLYKLLLYEEGGKFERHQDSEKEPGMFGTLVVMLPSKFSGGELVVHQPSSAKQGEPHLWDPAQMNSFDVKFAAFYGDCAHEVKPVTGGYRLCLTYNLVTTTAAEIPRFAGTDKIQEAVTLALSYYFTEPLQPKRPRYSWSSQAAVASSYRHFVYILEHDYSDQGLRFEFLKNKDYLIAQSLVKFCEDMGGEYVLYLSKLHYSHVSDPDVDDVDPEITVTLQKPWVKFGSSTPVKCPDVDVEHIYEVAPAGFLEGVDFDDCETEYTGNEGTREDQWYDTAALVIQPIAKEFDQLSQASAADVTTTLAQLVEARSPIAAEFARKFLARRHDWTSGSQSFRQCMRLIQTLNDLNIFHMLLRSASGFDFHPSMYNAVAQFGWDACIDTLVDLGRSAKLRSRVNLVTSTLHGEGSISRIAKLLDLLDLAITKIEPSKPQYSWKREPLDPFLQPTPDEYCRVLRLACQVSEEKLVYYLTSSDDRALITLLLPAFLGFVKSLHSVDSVSQVIGSLLQQLRARLPALRNAPFAEVKVDHDCDVCHALQVFLHSDSRDQTQLTAKHKTQFKHFESVLKRTNRYRSPKVDYVEVGAFTYQVTKQFGENKLLADAQVVLDQLTQVHADNSGGTPPEVIHLPPLQPSLTSETNTPRSLPRLASMIHPAQFQPQTLLAPDVIVIDDDSD